nr:maleylpyruvate isomerase N-terminal domain-containing protein [Glycomyces amatae]
MRLVADWATRRTRADRRELLWRKIHAERAALADDLAGLGDRQWETQSLCEESTVRQVPAHLTAGAPDR